MSSSSQIHNRAHQSALLDTLQRSHCVGEQSAFDMDKYLKKTDLSATTEVSVAHTTFDLTAWAENLNSSQGDSSLASGKRETQLESIRPKTEDTTSNINLPSISPLKSTSPGFKSDSKRNSVSVSSTRKSVGSEQTSTFNHSNKVGRSFSATAGTSTRTQTSHGGKQQDNLNTSKSNRASLETQNSDHSSHAFPIMSPDMKKGQSSCKVTSPLAHSLRSAVQQQQDRQNNSPEKKTLLRTISAPPLPSRSIEKHFDISQPPINQVIGK